MKVMYILPGVFLFSFVSLPLFLSLHEHCSHCRCLRFSPVAAGGFSRKGLTINKQRLNCLFVGNENCNNKTG